MKIADIVWDILPIVIFLLPIVTANIWGPFLKDYRFTAYGIDIVILGGWKRVFHIKRQDIRGATIVPGLLARLKYPFALGMQNRCVRRVLIVTTGRGTSYMLTPAHPEDALRLLGIRPHK